MSKIPPLQPASDMPQYKRPLLARLAAQHKLELVQQPQDHNDEYPVLSDITFMCTPSGSDEHASPMPIESVYPPTLESFEPFQALPHRPATILAALHFDRPHDEPVQGVPAAAQYPTDVALYHEPHTTPTNLSNSTLLVTKDSSITPDELLQLLENCLFDLPPTDDPHDSTLKYFQDDASHLVQRILRSDHEAASNSLSRIANRELDWALPEGTIASLTLFAPEPGKPPRPPLVCVQSMDPDPND